MPIRLYVGNLPKEAVERQALQTMFVDAGEIMSIKVIKDRKTGKCRGFAFVTVATDELADAFIEKYNGQSFMDSPLKIEKALPREKGKESEEDQVPTTTEAAPSPKPARKKTDKKRPRNQGSDQTSSNESFQPDPRWADKLNQLKEMLAASSSN